MEQRGGYMRATKRNLSDNAAVIELDRRHAAETKRRYGKKQLREYEFDQATDAAAALAGSAVAYHPDSEEGKLAKIRVFCRQYAFLGATEVLKDRNGALPLVKSIIEDIFADSDRLLTLALSGR